MALGAVQSGYAGETSTYRRRESLQEEFYSNIFSITQKMEGELEDLSGVQKELEKQREIYQSFIRKLEKVQEEEKGNATGAAGKSDGAPEEPDDNDLMRLIRERILELHDQRFGRGEV